MTLCKQFMTETLNNEHEWQTLCPRIDGEALDYDLLRHHIRRFSESDVGQSQAVTIYDNFRHEHAYASEYHRQLFGSGEMEVHPDDRDDVTKNAIATLRHIFHGNKNTEHLKLVREYRAKVGSRYRRVTETLQVLERDSSGNIWLTLCLLEISPNQMAPFSVHYQIVDTITGDLFSPQIKYLQNESVLTDRELEVLTLIAQGKLSKEISELLHISVYTVNTHRQRILEKLNVDNSHEAVRCAMLLGLIKY